MDTTADLDAFLADFGVDVSGPSSTSGFGILDAPDSVLADGQVISTEYSLTVKRSDFPSLKRGDGLTIDGDEYTVREPLAVDDGAFIKVLVSKD